MRCERSWMRARASGRRGPLAAVLILQLVTFLLVVACGDPAPSAPAPNVVVVVMDTVRMDHLGLYGYERETSPNLDALAAESRVYDNAHSVSNWTAPSHASLFTGHYPVAHELTREHRRLDTPLPTLAELLRHHGYETFAVVSNAVVMGQALYARGFSQYRQPWLDRQRKVEEIKYLPEDKQKIERGLWGTLDRENLREVGSWLEDRRPDRPFFLFVNLIGAHTPYLSAGPYQDSFDPELERSEEQADLLWHYGKTFHWYAEYYLGRNDLDDADIEFLIKHYDAEIRYVDHQVGMLVKQLRESGVYDDTLFIVTADHGEAFGEAGVLGHEFALHDVLTRIPLIIRYPKRFEPGSRDSSPVQILDIFPTVLELAGVKRARTRSQGVSLVSGELDPERPVFLELSRGLDILKGMKKRADTPEELERLEALDRRVRGLICGDFKLIQASNGRHEFYRRSTDPGEENNLYGQAEVADEIARCREQLDALVKKYAAGRPPRRGRGNQPEMDETRKDALRALGYIE
jgi:arylsulfatase A-like enzyme